MEQGPQLSDDMDKAMSKSQYVKDRFSEPSSWTAVAVLLLGADFLWMTQNIEAMDSIWFDVLAVGAFVCAAIGVLKREGAL